MYKVPANDAADTFICQNSIFIRVSIFIPHYVITSVVPEAVQIKVSDIYSTGFRCFENAHIPYAALVPWNTVKQR